MKRKAIALALALMLGVSTLSACGDNKPQLSASPSQAPTPSIAESPIPTSATYEKDNSASSALNEYMKSGFSETSWHSYIDEYTVYSNGESYRADVTLTEMPFDHSLSVLMWKYFTDTEAEIVNPIILDAAAGLGLDEIDLCLMAEGLSKIYNSSDIETAYSSLSALGLPVYDYCATALEVSKKDVMDNIDIFVGAKAVDFILNGLEQDYAGSFTGLSMSNAKTIGMSAMANFKDVYISEIDVLSPDGKKVGTFSNMTSPS